MPSTAATLPSPAETAKISTHNTVGTARTNAVRPLMMMVSQRGAKFWAARSASPAAHWRRCPREVISDSLPPSYNGARGRIMLCKRHFNAHNSARLARGGIAARASSARRISNTRIHTNRGGAENKTRRRGRRGSVHAATRGKEVPSPRHREKRSRREWHEGDGGRRGTAAAHGEQGARRGGPESRSVEDEEIEARKSWRSGWSMNE